jgi:imidazolonepropionase
MLLTNLQLATMTGGYGLIPDAAIRIDGQAIAWAGPRSAAPPGNTVDCGGRLVTPGLIDCHTHLIYGSNRANEFEMRLNGASYPRSPNPAAASMPGARHDRPPRRMRKTALKRLDSLLAEGITPSRSSRATVSTSKPS